MTTTIEQTFQSLRRRNRSYTMASEKVTDYLALHPLPNGKAPAEPDDDSHRHVEHAQEVAPTVTTPMRFALLLPALLSIYAIAGWVIFVAVPLLPVVAASLTLFLASVLLFPFVLGASLLSLCLVPAFAAFRLAAKALEGRRPDSAGAKTIRLLAAPGLLLWGASWALIGAMQLYSWLWSAPVLWIDRKARDLLRPVEDGREEDFVAPDSHPPLEDNKIDS